MLLASKRMMLAWGAIAMRPLDVERFLQRPIRTARGARWRNIGQRGAPVLVQHGERRPAGVERLQAELAVERRGVVDDIRIVISIDDGDRLALAVAGDPADAIGGLDLGRGVGRSGCRSDPRITPPDRLVDNVIEDRGGTGLRRKLPAEDASAQGTPPQRPTTAGALPRARSASRADAFRCARKTCHDDSAGPTEIWSRIASS